MTKEPFAARKESIAPDLDIDELEGTRTAALARMHPNEIGRDDTEKNVVASIENHNELAIGEVEPCLLEAARDRLRAAGSLSLEGMIAGLSRQDVSSPS